MGQIKAPRMGQISMPIDNADLQSLFVVLRSSRISWKIKYMIDNKNELIKFNHLRFSQIG